MFVLNLDFVIPFLISTLKNMTFHTRIEFSLLRKVHGLRFLVFLKQHGHQVSNDHRSYERNLSNCV